MKYFSPSLRTCDAIFRIWVSRQAVWLYLLLVATLSLFITGCESPAETAGLVGATIVTGAISPANEIEQVYYLGVFDPEEQLPPQVYRVRVHGQSSAISGDSFASGWVPSQLMDSLGGQTTLNPYGNGGPVSVGPSANQAINLNVGRRLWMFGPEGFREAPANERLSIVMSADPSGFFNAVDQMLGITVPGASQASSGTVQADLLSAYHAMLNSREQLQKVQQQIPSGNP